ncbi:MAG: hypothetical protein HDR22_02225 [Lachnospiraceae bacterium]|nr:hypothetical protein [Lachnospiraceae bacterium]
MNEEIILKLVEPYLEDKSITYDEFDNIFSFLSRKEQYAVTDILCANNILLRDDEEVNINIDDDKAIIENVEPFEALYDVNIFKDKIGCDNGSTYVKTYNSIKQSNEILCSLIQEGNAQAKQDLCVKNKKLVQKYAYAYQKYCGNKIDVEDIEQAGFIGLIKASERYAILVCEELAA